MTPIPTYRAVVLVVLVATALAAALTASNEAGAVAGRGRPAELLVRHEPRPARCGPATSTATETPGDPLPGPRCLNRGTTRGPDTLALRWIEAIGVQRVRANANWPADNQPGLSIKPVAR